MSSNPSERSCVICGDTEEMARLEMCSICRRDFCHDCAYRATGRRFCGAACARTFFYGDIDDEDAQPDDDDA